MTFRGFDYSNYCSPSLCDSEISPKTNYCSNLTIGICINVCMCVYRHSSKNVEKENPKSNIDLCGGGGNKHEREDRALQITKSYK